MKLFMRPRRPVLILLVTLALLLAAVLSLQSAGTIAQAGVSHITQGAWQVTAAPAFDAAPALPDSRSWPGPWRRAGLPLSLPRVDAPQGGVSITWLRVALPAAGQTGAGALALYGARIKSDGPIAVYADGKLLQTSQEQGQLWSSLFTPLWLTLERRDGDAPLGELLIRIQHKPDYLVAVSSLWLGPADILRSRYQLRLWLQRGLPQMLNSAFLAVGVFALFVWLRRRESGYLLFFVLATVSYVAHLHYYAELPIAGDWFGWVTLNSLFWLLAVVHVFLRQLHGRPLTVLTRCLVGATIAVGLATMPLPGALPNSPLVLAMIYAVALAIGVTVAVVGGVSAWRTSREGRWIAAGLCLCVVLGMSDWMLHNNVIDTEHWFLGAYTNAVTFIMFGGLMYQRYVHAIREVETVNASLAQRLLQREQELELSHARLRAVEMRQTISDERQRLMQDMHDGLGSSLIGAIRAVERADAGIDVSHILRGCLDDLKLTIDSMEPVEADLLLLLATLRFRLEPRLESAGVALQWKVRDVPALDWLDPTRALHILRIVQESIANILQHTRATEIRIETAAEREHVLISVTDNGHGFDTAAALAAARGHGLQNQQRRARALGGAVAWASDAGGTRFTLRLPLAATTGATTGVSSGNRTRALP
jgi:signal transduction histidine kinase